jgi:hypothetical protein
MLRLLVRAALLFDAVEVIWRKIIAIIWKVEPLPSPAVRNSPINTR